MAWSAFGVQQPPSSTGWHLQGVPSSWAQPSAAGADLTSRPLSSWDLPPARPVSSWDLPSPRGPSSPSSPYEVDPILGRPRTSWDLPAPRIIPESCSNPSDGDYSDPYAYDSPFRRPLTSWDLPSPRFESYGGGGSSQYEYGASENQGGGSYSPYSNYGGGYSGGRYVNEPNPYVPPPPPPREGDYVLAPQPKPPFSLSEWRLPTWDLGSRQATTPAVPILAPSLPLVQHQLQPLPAPCATPPPPSRDGFYVPVPQPCVSDPPPSRIELVPRPANPEIEEKERGRVSFSMGSKLVEEAGDSKVLDSAGTQKPNPVKATHGSGIGEGDLNNVVESSAVVNNDDELCNKFPVDGSFIVIRDVVRDVEGEQLGRGTKIILFFKEDQSMEYIGERRIKDLVREYSEFINYPIGLWMEKFVEKEISDALNDELKKDKEEEREVEREILEVLRRLVIFRIYALKEVYKDFCISTLRTR